MQNRDIIIGEKNILKFAVCLSHSIIYFLIISFYVSSGQFSFRVTDSFLSIWRTVFCLSHGKISVDGELYIDAICLADALTLAYNKLMLFKR